jgi:hypothetical protein
MGYSARYHAASLVAVFLALAVGILIGVGFGSDVVNGTADDLEHSLESDLDDARQQVTELEGQLDAERDFEGAIYPAVVANQLRGKRIALVGFGGLDSAITDDVDAAVGPGGAQVSEVAVVNLPPDLDALADLRRGHGARAIAHGDPGAVSALGADAGRALISGGSELSELRGSLLGRYSGSARGIDAVAVVRDQPASDDPDVTAAMEALEEGLIDGLRSRRVPPVGVELESTSPSNVGFFKSTGISSVDNLDQLSGKVALVFALGGAAGNFGVKESADSLLPDLLAPATGTEGKRSKGG